MVKRLSFLCAFPSKQMTKADARKAIDEIRSEAAGFPEMSLEEINAEINAARTERSIVDELYGMASNVSMTLDEIRDERLTQK